MDRTTYRLLFSSLALIPALTVVLTILTGGFEPPATLLTIACCLTAVGASLTEPRAPRGTLRTQAALRRIPRDLPSEDRQRATLNRVLTAEDQPMTTGMPLSREQAAAWILRHTLAAWPEHRREIDTLPSEPLATLFLLARLLTASPGEAGRLAQFFRRPDAVLALRDQLDAIARARALWDRENRLFLATQWLWTRQKHEGRPRSLAEALQALGPTDIDLWHRVVLEHDPQRPDQREAALWCLRQPGCDRATVAAYLAHAALDGQLIGAARRGNSGYLDAVRSLVANWNAGHYRTAELALDPPGALVEAEPRVAQTFDRLAVLTGTPWPMPRSAFVRYEGRPPRLRRAWDLDAGRLRGDPERADYLDPPAVMPAQPHLL